MFSSDLIRNEFITFVVTLYDLLWFNRNSVAQGSSSLSVQDRVFKATKSAKDHWKSILSSSTASRSFSNQTWPRGWIKISTDTTFAQGKAQSSCIHRNCNSSIVSSGLLLYLMTASILCQLKHWPFLKLLRLSTSLRSRMQFLKLILWIQFHSLLLLTDLAIGLRNQWLMKTRGFGIFGPNGSSNTPQER